MTKHKHHIIPKHMGGSNDPSNLVELTIEEHAEAHRKLYEEYGRWQDEIAWKALSGQISRQDAIKLSQKNADKSWMKTAEGREIMKIAANKRTNKIPWNKGLTKETSEKVAVYAEKVKTKMKSGDLPTIGDRMKGKKFSENHKKLLSDKAKNRTKIVCKHCLHEFAPALHARWHGDKCKDKI